MRVMVYWNIRQKRYSVKALEGADEGRVVAHVEQILLKDAEFKVSAASRLRVVESQRKSVHAGVIGEVEALWGAELHGEVSNSTVKGLAIGKPFKPFDGEHVFYNPYTTDTFVRKSDMASIKKASRVHFDRHEGKAVVLAEGLQ